METAFTPLASLGGGILIGIASVLLMAFHGRIFGATGILGGLLEAPGSADWTWRAVVMAGMVSGPAAYLVLTGGWPEISVPVSLPLLLIGGFLVGVGVTFGRGCTSGHGVCGMARFSGRSFVATLTFMAVTGITVYLTRHVIGV